MGGRRFGEDLSFSADCTVAARLLFVHRWGRTMAGGERWINNLSDELIRRGCHVSAALHTNGPLSSALQGIGVSVYMRNIEFLQSPPKYRLLSTGLSTMQTSIDLARLVKRTRSQLIHAFSLEAAESAYLAARISHVPIVVTVMNCGVPYPLLDTQVLKRCDGVIAISESVENDLLSLWSARTTGVDNSTRHCFR